jgi:hypothetical protein
LSADIDDQFDAGEQKGGPARATGDFGDRLAAGKEVAPVSGANRFPKGLFAGPGRTACPLQGRFARPPGKTAGGNHLGRAYFRAVENDSFTSERTYVDAREHKTPPLPRDRRGPLKNAPTDFSAGALAKT